MVKNDRTFWRITDLGKQALGLGALKRAKKQIEALNLLLTQDLEKVTMRSVPQFGQPLKAKIMWKRLLCLLNKKVGSKL